MKINLVRAEQAISVSDHFETDRAYGFWRKICVFLDSFWSFGRNLTCERRLTRTIPSNPWVVCSAPPLAAFESSFSFQVPNYCAPRSSRDSLQVSLCSYTECSPASSLSFHCGPSPRLLRLLRRSSSHPSSPTPFSAVFTRARAVTFSRFSCTGAFLT